MQYKTKKNNNNFKLKVFFILIILSFFTNLYAQNTIWEKQYVFPVKNENEKISGNHFIKENSVGDFYLHYGTGFFYGNGLCKIDKNGNLVWNLLRLPDSIWGGKTSLYAANMYVDKNDNCLLIGGLLRDFIAYDYGYWVVNNSGKIAKIFIDSLGESILSGSKGNVQIGNNLFVSLETNTNNKITFYWLDTNANVLRKTAYSDKNKNVEFISPILNRLSNGDLVVWSGIDFSGAYGKTAIFLTDSLGNQKWSYYVYHQGDTLTQNVDLIETQDGNLLLLANLQISIQGWSSSTRVELLKITPLGDLLWIKTIHATDVWEELGKTYATCIAQTRDGGFVIGGHVSTDKSNPDNVSPAIIKTDKNGNILWKKIYQTTDSAQLNEISNILISSDNKIIVSGLWDKGNIFLSKIDDPIAEVEDNKQYDAVDISVLGNECHIQNNSIIGNYTICNTLGLVLKSGKIANGKADVSIIDLKSGTYFIYIRSGTKQTIRKIFIER